MKKKDLEKMIFSAYKAETPELRPRIVEACKKECQEFHNDEIRKSSAFDKWLHFDRPLKSIAAAAICLMLFAVGISLGIFMSDGKEPVQPVSVETIVYIDVNPSVELRVDGANNVVDCIPVSEDAEKILVDLQIKGVSLNTAIKAIVGSMYVNGYIAEDSNSILITVASVDESMADSLLFDITKKINSVFENSGMECAIIAQCVNIDDELKLGAEKYGISVGKMHLLRKIVDKCGGLATNEVDVLSGLSIKDLNLIYSQKSNNDNNDGHEFIYGEVKLTITKDEAINKILEHLEKDVNDVSRSHCLFRLSRYDNTKVVYAVTLKLNDDSTVYRYEVDCQSGELFKIENKTKK